ncbi:MAG: cobalamin-binding protein [Anaerolineae bacterium]|nr:cobalamin-binding protein [Anaerolineae bacterium]
MKLVFIRSLSISLLLVLLLSACAPAAAALPTAAPAPQGIHLTDNLGRSVNLPSAPQRIISLAPSNTEILFAIGAGKNVVGVTSYCDYPLEAKKLPQIGGFSAKTISIESIIALKPDLVVAYGDQQTSVVEALDESHIAVVVINPQSFDDIYGSISLLGQATGHVSDAETLVASMKARVAAVAEKTASIPAEKRPTVFWEVFDEPLMTTSTHTATGQMIELAGGVNIFSDLKEDYPQISAEEVIKRNPAVIMGPDTHGSKLSIDQLGSRPGWSVIEAVKTGRVYLLDGNISSRSGPRMVDALETAAKMLYPDLFK